MILLRPAQVDTGRDPDPVAAYNPEPSCIREVGNKGDWPQARSGSRGSVAATGRRCESAAGRVDGRETWWWANLAGGMVVAVSASLGAVALCA